MISSLLSAVIPLYGEVKNMLDFFFGRGKAAVTSAHPFSAGAGDATPIHVLQTSLIPIPFCPLLQVVSAAQILKGIGT